MRFPLMVFCLVISSSILNAQQKNFQKAAISFAKGYQKFPKGNKAIDQLFKLALTFINLGKNDDACASFSKLELEFPDASERIKNRAKEYKTRAKC